MNEERVTHKVPMELIVDYERERTVVRLDFSEIADATEPEGPVEEAEWILLESDMNRDLMDDLDSSSVFEFRQRKGTQMLYVVDVSEDGRIVHIRASDGSYAVTTGHSPI